MLLRNTVSEQALNRKISSLISMNYKKKLICCPFTTVNSV
ncbi:MAG: hypothetical protein ACI88G_001618, partial [Woeseiaceae bacterium]